jgi:hypothetical protein
VSFSLRHVRAFVRDKHEARLPFKRGARVAALTEQTGRTEELSGSETIKIVAGDDL